MKMRFILLIKRPFESAARRILLNRLIDRDNPWKSRLLREDLDPILARAWGDFQKLWPEAPATQNFGNWHATAIAVYTLAIYRALRSANLSHDYAIELTSDLIWVFHIPWFPIINFVGFLSAGSNARKRVEKGVTAFATKYWKEPGNEYYFPKDKSGAFRINVLKCAMHQFFAKFGKEEMELFSKTHCMLDFTIARVMVKGGWYERPNTLSSGHSACTMFYHANPRGKENAEGPLPIGPPPKPGIVMTAEDDI